MRQWLTLITISIALAQLSWAQPSPLSIQWLSNGAPPNTDSRFPSISADGNQVVFQVGNGLNAQIWLAATQDNDGDGKVDEDPINNIDDDEDGRVDEDPVDWRTFQLTDPQSNQPLLGIHPVISADGNHIAFASTQPYGGVSSTRNKWQIYVLDRLQNRIVPISFLWQDTNGDGMRDTDNFEPSNGNCVPVAISADGRIVVFLAQFPQAQNIVDADGNGITDTLSNLPTGWLVLVHDRDADGNGIYDEAGIGATRTFVGSMGNNGNPLPAASVSVSANGRFIAFATPVNPANPDENWRVIVRDWQNGDQVEIPNAFAPALSDDGTYLAYLQPTAALNEPSPTYLQSKMNLVVQRIRDQNGQLTSSVPPLSLANLNLSPQPGTADGSAGWGYSDWWGAVTIAVDPNDANLAYVAFHAWVAELPRDNDGDGRVDEDPINGRDDDNDGLTDEDPPTDLIDLQRVHRNLFVSLDGMNSPDPLRVYQGVPNIFLARFNFAAGDVRMWLLLRPSPNWSWRGLPISLENGLDDDRDGRVDEDPVDGRDNDGDGRVDEDDEFRLPLAPSLLPAVSFVNGNQLAIVFQSLAAFNANDKNGLWDVYLATVTLP